MSNIQAAATFIAYHKGSYTDALIHVSELQNSGIWSAKTCREVGGAIFQIKRIMS